MSVENEETETVEPTLRETIEAAMTEHSEPAEAVETSVAVEKPATEGRDESGRFKPKEEQVAAPIIAAKEAPTHWKAEAKEKFKDLPPEMQDVILGREKEMEVIASRVDDERRLGKDLKDVITPYMAIIQAEGGTPQGAVKDLLNTAYILRTGSPQQKAAIVSQVMRQYNVDPAMVGQAQQGQQYQQPQVVSQLSEEQIVEKAVKRLQEQQTSVNINSEIAAFAADPKNVHFAILKPVMKGLLENEQATSLQDAYDQACWANPQIRQSLMAAQAVDAEAKRKEELVAKRKAGSSVSGSPGLSVPNSGIPDRSLREEIAANMAAQGY